MTLKIFFNIIRIENVIIKKLGAKYVIRPSQLNKCLRHLATYLLQSSSQLDSYTSVNAKLNFHSRYLHLSSPHPLKVATPPPQKKNCSDCNSTTPTPDHSQCFL